MIIKEQYIKQIIGEEIFKETLKRKILNFSKQISEGIVLKEEDIEKFISDNPSSDQLKLFLDMINNLESKVNDLKAIQNRLKPESADYKEAEKNIQALKSKVRLIMQQWTSPMAFEKAQHDLEKAHDEAIQINKQLTAKEEEILDLGPEYEVPKTDVLDVGPEYEVPKQKQKFKDIIKQKINTNPNITQELPKHDLKKSDDYLAKKRAERTAKITTPQPSTTKSKQQEPPVVTKGDDYLAKKRAERAAKMASNK